MSREINKPTEATFYRAYGPGVIHEGITDPGLVTTTGQPSFVYSADAGEFAGMVANSDSPVEPMPVMGEEVTRGTVYDFEGTAYVCVQSHTRTADDPSIIPALFTPARAQASPWVQPTGAQDAYVMGDKATHNGHTWDVTEVDANGYNVWEPGVFGWTVVA